VQSQIAREVNDWSCMPLDDCDVVHSRHRWLIQNLTPAMTAVVQQAATREDRWLRQLRAHTCHFDSPSPKL
jgi:hypothetical protein